MRRTATLQSSARPRNGSRRAAAPFLTNFGRIETLYRTGTGRGRPGRRPPAAGFPASPAMASRAPTPRWRAGIYAVGLALAKRDDEARKEFQASVPLLTATTFNTDNDDVLNAAARTRYTQVVVENYIALLGRLGASAGPDVANDTFRLADSIRSRSVQKALTAAGARMTTSDPKLAAACARSRICASRSARSLASSTRCWRCRRPSATTRASRRCARTSTRCAPSISRVRADIDRQFPEYADLIDPKPPTSAQIKEILKPGEALLSFYFGRDASFVWAISQDGKVEFAALRESAAVDRGQDQEAARGAGAAGGDDLRHPGVRSRAVARSLQDAAGAGEGRRGATPRA